MKLIQHLLSVLALLVSIATFSQNNPERKKIKITGAITEKISKQALEYATITFVNTKNPKVIFGGITNAKGEFDVEVNPGIYTIKAEFISFKPTEIKEKKLFETTNLGIILLDEDATQLNQVEVRAEKSTVEIKLDKKVYNVGKDMIVKGGTASDVLDNVPSVTVDGDGNVSLRGNENVKILIDGRPSNAINIADALRTISADALDKVEVITNPSSRYDAEGGAGIINIVLKKGKNQGVNGTIIATLGDPKNYGLVSSINYKTENFNLFGSLGYNDSKAPGKTLTDSDYLNPDGSIQKTINERSTRERGRKGYNYNFGMDWFLDKTLTWTNALSYRKNDGSNPDNVLLYNYEPNNIFVRNRFNNQYTNTNDAEYTTNFTKKFKKDGHKLTVDASFSRNIDNDSSIITDFVIGQENNATKESSKNFQTQSRNLIQTDYVLPIGKNGQFEAGYKGNFNELLTDYNVGNLDPMGNYTPNLNYTNVFDYKEKINAFYTQFGSKINSFSYLLGMRYENSNIDINLLTTNNFTNKKYDSFFPSAFLTYQINEESSLSINYSRRISRPRNRFINPFSNYSSNVNIFQGNPDINPSFTDAIDFGYMTKWKKVTLSSSAYFNQTKDVFQFIRRPNGEIITSIVNGETIETPVMLSTPINLSNENRFGFEFNVNYSPYKWWRLNGNFNFFQSSITGNYSYTLAKTNEIVNENFDNKALGWFSKVSSKVTLPLKIDWQTNATYNAPQNNAQGKSLGVFSANLAFSKDVLKDKATVALNVNDVFNSRKRINQTNLPTLNSYSEMQQRQRQINLSFTYRFNKLKTEKDKTQKRDTENGGDEF
ncbi:TonB-dependent receptor domain-containing protein [Flavobacterium psychrotolerans]|uniref:TonB-dependent receptor n=1 Tax=Flavobacterium psychrotolerans TaxID=2169410 RepID=A0A2U1JI08_9FLAO|nr:TonB-dependent receptor [Flavobacterium psychrotolerans]PWA04645.1 TonB-dependent receptor [Flavobacterium psychrotolerans]